MWPGHTLGLSFSGTAAAGAGMGGGTVASGQVSVVGSTHAVGLAESGGVATSAFDYTGGVPVQSPGAYAAGIYAGGGLTLNLSTGEPSDLAGPFTGFGEAAGIGPLNFSFEMMCSGNACQFSFGLPVLSWGVGIASYSLTTNTAVQQLQYR